MSIMTFAVIDGTYAGTRLFILWDGAGITGFARENGTDVVISVLDLQTLDFGGGKSIPVSSDAAFFAALESFVTTYCDATQSLIVENSNGTSATASAVLTFPNYPSLRQVVVDGRLKLGFDLAVNSSGGSDSHTHIYGFVELCAVLASQCLADYWRTTSYKIVISTVGDDDVMGYTLLPQSVFMDSNPGYVAVDVSNALNATKYYLNNLLLTPGSADYHLRQVFEEQFFRIYRALDN